MTASQWRVAPRPADVEAQGREGVAMRILHAIRSEAFAGVESHVARLAAGQARAGHTVAVIGGEQAGMQRAMAGADVIHRPAGTVPDVVREIDRLRGCDILHVHMTAAEAATLFAVRSWSRPVVATRHFARRRGSSLLVRMAAPLIARRIDAQIAISAFVAKAADGASTSVYPGLELDTEPLAAVVDRTPTVLVVQRLEAEKRTEDAIEIFARSGVADRGWRLVIAGDGAQRQTLERRAQQLGVSSTTEFLGHHRDVPALMRTAGVLIAPCDIEGLGLTVLEAMSVGLPVVAAAAGGHLETVGRVPGAALYPRRDLSAGASSLRGLVDDLERRGSYGAALWRTQQEHFTIESQVRGTDAVYRSVL